MKKIIFLFLLVTTVTFSQETVIEIDYVVDYIIPNNKKESVDTVSIGFNKNGKYLWTNYNILGNEFSKSILLGNTSKINDTEFNLIYSVEDNKMILYFNFDKSKIYANVDIETIVPMDRRDAFDEDFNLVATKLNEEKSILDYSCSTFDLHPDNDPSDAITVLVANDLDCKNNVFFSKFVSLMLKMTSSKGEIKSDIPDGLILKAYDKSGSPMIEAINVDKNKKTITINQSFKITE